MPKHTQVTPAHLKGKEKQVQHTGDAHSGQAIQHLACKTHFGRAKKGSNPTVSVGHFSLGGRHLCSVSDTAPERSGWVRSKVASIVGSIEWDLPLHSSNSRPLALLALNGTAGPRFLPLRTPPLLLLPFGVKRTAMGKVYCTREQPLRRLQELRFTAGFAPEANFPSHHLSRSRSGKDHLTRRQDDIQVCTLGGGGSHREKLLFFGEPNSQNPLPPPAAMLL